MTIPLLQPSVTDAEIEEVTNVLRSRWWGNGPVVKRFEESVKKIYGYEHCVATNSCTAALHLAMIALGIGPGDEVIVPAMTFVSTGYTPLYVGATPVLADIRPDTLCIDWSDVANKMTCRTKAVISVDYAGYPANDGNGAVRIGVPVIQDAAHSCGGLAYGDLICLSFHPVKNLATGDGGAILTSSGEYEKVMRAAAWCGIDRSTWERQLKRYNWDYNIDQIGYKYHWNDVQAAIGVAQLGRLREMNDRRRKIAERYFVELDGYVRLPAYHNDHTWHLFVVGVDNRDAVVDFIIERDVSVGVHYKPLSHYPMFAGECPVAETSWLSLLSLPIFADMKDWQQSKVIDTLKRALEETR